MRKAEARIARAAQKQLKANEKAVRLRERPRDEKSARLGADPGSIFHLTMSWTIEHADRTDAWSSGTSRQWSEDDWGGIIEPKLAEWSRLTWSEIDSLSTGNPGKRHKMHHSMDVDVILDEAQLRLIDLGKYEETIFRFRLGNKLRLWGFRRVSEFHVTWYDPKHEIYPVEPD